MSGALGCGTVPGGSQKDLVLILARELASHVASPVFLVDAKGTLIYYNEHAEGILGLRFEEAGELPAEDWGKRWDPRDPDDRSVPLEELPLTIAFRERRPAHRPLVITGLDGMERSIEATALPLLSKDQAYVGALAVFWEQG